MDGVHGFVFGKLGDNYMTKKEDKDGHILVVGGAGSGKTSCIAIPSLRTWSKRIFAIDIKGELYKHTQHKRPNIKVFDPLDKAKHGYDPFYLLGKTDNLAQEVHAISLALVPLPHDTKEAFWVQGAQNMLTGALLYFYNLGYSFIKAIKKIQSTPITKLVDDIYDNTESEDTRMYIVDFVSMETKLLTGIRAELTRHIMPFATDQNIIECLSRTDKISPDDLEQDKDIYICIPEHLLRQWRNLLTLIVSQFLRHFEKRPEQTATPILFLLDEFARLGHIEGMIDALATLRSKKITICPILQSLAQLDLIYGENARRVIVDNCQYKAVLNATDADSQEYFSRLVGTFEKEKTTTGLNTSFFHASLNKSTTSEEKRKLKPEEFAMLEKIALFTPFGFFKVDKTPYYKNSNI